MSPADLGGLVASRYGQQTAPVGVLPNPVVESLLSHRSVRAYAQRSLPPQTLETLVAAAQSAATSSNLQSWSVVAVSDPAVRRTLAAVADGQRHIEQCPLFLVWLADTSRLADVARRRGAEAEALPYIESFLTAAIDASLAAQNAVVAAEGLGLSTVYIGALRNDPEAVARALILPAGAFAVFGLCVGYAADGAAGSVKPRLPQDAVLHRDRYRTDQQSLLVDTYDGTLAQFWLGQGRRQQTWSERVLDRVRRVADLHGRDQLKSGLRALGFPLR